MCPPVAPDIQKIIAKLGLPERFRVALASYVKKLIRGLAPDCVILYGSLAKGTYNTASDIDLVVISPRLSGDFLGRLTILQELNVTSCPVDALGYTPDEFRDMLRKGHVTALDALADGVPVWGVPYFDESEQIFQYMSRRGLHRTTCTWVLPEHVAPN